ncbi:RagB/SusD family nutrient uptake outer membrane protein [Flavobacterium nitrogenifigens]|uniref:Starch-binding associating with outer membrane n=1 Tax=Flavobacterium nitrogenifigens TaxID=1617283 RepID=A0A521D0W2_9FLAO|nr:RagB/SusD family nutrient uptake outer membrane protein [Flavobacterium nitrogenifigens]KAF2332790.1 RagB/SusD family nutrient uptake outer membrane protein [Flavobacterium nitrogenifigens]SMO65302.1 Starch-binding associating with outer membrane [Flavobacterium nitrogenifigens]
MKRYIKLFALSSLLVLGACSEDFLENEPYTDKVTENFYKTPSDAFEGLVAVYDVLQREAYGGPLLISEQASDDCFGGYGIADAQSDIEWDRFLYVSDKDMNKDVWSNAYLGIYRANILLENIDKVNWGSDTALKTRYEAEARFLRAHFHFTAAKMFGDIIPLDHTVTTSEFELPRQAPEVTYALIASDLKFAADNLGPENYSQAGNANYGRITKWAAEAYLARTFLFYTGTYGKADLAGVVSKAEATAYINDVVNNSGHGLVADFANLWLAASFENFAGEDNTEMVWAVRFNGSGKGNWDLHEGNRFQVNIAPRGGAIGRYATGWGGATVNPKLVSLYEAGDTRKAASFIDYAGEGLNFDAQAREQRQYTGYSWKKYCPITNEAGTAVVEANGGNFQIDNYQDYAIIRFSDVLLMAAELNLSSNQALAQADFDRVRDRAFKNTTNRKTASIENIMKERQLELALEGHRYFDLIRQGMTAMKLAIDNTAGGSQFTVTFRTETQGWLPLPQSQIILSNGTITQNPGWN